MTKNFAPRGINGPASSMGEVPKSAEFNDNAILYSSFYCTTTTELTFFGYDGKENKIPVNAYQTIICYIKGVKIDGEGFDANTRVIGYRIT